MKIRNSIVFATILFSFALTEQSFAHRGFPFPIPIPVPIIPVPAPGPPVVVVPSPEPEFVGPAPYFYGGWWWWNEDGIWHRAYHRHGPWHDYYGRIPDGVYYHYSGHRGWEHRDWDHDDWRWRHHHEGEYHRWHDNRHWDDD